MLLAERVDRAIFGSLAEGFSQNAQYGTERVDVLSSDRATSENGVALQKRAAKLDALRVKQAATRFALERRRGSTVPPAPPLLHGHFNG